MELNYFRYKSQVMKHLLSFTFLLFVAFSIQAQDGQEGQVGQEEQKAQSEQELQKDVQSESEGIQEAQIELVELYTTLEVANVLVERTGAEGNYLPLKKGDVLHAGDRVIVSDTSFLALFDVKGGAVQVEAGNYAVDSIAKPEKNGKEALAIFNGIVRGSQPKTKQKPSDMTLLEAMDSDFAVNWEVENKAWLLNDDVILNWDNANADELKIFDMYEKVLKAQNVNGTSSSISFETLSSHPKQYFLVRLFKEGKVVSPTLALYVPEEIEKDEKLAGLKKIEGQLPLDSYAGQKAYAVWAKQQQCYLEAIKACAKVDEMRGQKQK